VNGLSSDNTQCWKFGLDKQSISIQPDYKRRCPIFDPDDHRCSRLPSRQSPRPQYDANPLSNKELNLLETAGSGNVVRVHILTTKTAAMDVTQLIPLWLNY
jgi:hypothetical protein